MPPGAPLETHQKDHRGAHEYLRPAGPVIAQLPPRRMHVAASNRWASTSGGVTGGGIWGPGGVIFDQKGGAFIYTATGNANDTPENVGFAERVVKLDSGLNVIASNGPALSGED